MTTATTILISTATAHCALATRTLVGNIETESEKAVCLRVWKENGTTGPKVWFPKKALVNKNGVTKLAHWFKMNDYQRGIVAAFSQVSMIAA